MDLEYRCIWKGVSERDIALHGDIGQMQECRKCEGYNTECQTYEEENVRLFKRRRLNEQPESTIDVDGVKYRMKLFQEKQTDGSKEWTEWTVKLTTGEIFEEDDFNVLIDKIKDYIRRNK